MKAKWTNLLKRGSAVFLSFAIVLSFMPGLSGMEAYAESEDGSVLAVEADGISEADGIVLENDDAAVDDEKENGAVIVESAGEPAMVDGEAEEAVAVEAAEDADAVDGVEDETGIDAAEDSMTGIRFGEDSITKEVGDDITLTLAAEPAESTESIDMTLVRWTISDEAVVEQVDQNVFKAVGAGEAVITAEYNGYTATCTVTVTEPAPVVIPITSVTLSKTAVSLLPGKTLILTATVNPTDTTESKTVTWTSSNKTVATVSSAGKITAKKPGTATITAKAGTKTATCKVTVKTIPLKTLTISKKTAKMLKGKTLKLSVKYTPANTTVSKKVTWTSSNKKIATVNKYGKVTAKKKGKVTITAKMGGKKVKCKITVREIPLKKIKLSKTKRTLTAGKHTKLSVIYSPKNTTVKKNVKWKSSNTDVAIVLSDGTVVAKTGGTCKITARVGGKKATCKVTVKQPSCYYMDPIEGYAWLDWFRTYPGVQHWNSDNKTVTEYNSKGNIYLGSLKRDAKLEKTAKIRAKELSKQFDHVRPDGTICFTAYPDYGAGENILVGTYDAETATWLWSEGDQKYDGQGHRRNMLNPDFNRVGIACYCYHGTYYWVQAFGW